MNKLKELEEYLEKQDRITIVTGAGISTLSGIPDYSSMDGTIVNGIYYHPRDILSVNFLERFPNDFWEWYYEQFVKTNFKPNKIHNWISGLISKYPDKEITIITQNVDGLQQRSLTSLDINNYNNLIEFHGNSKEVICKDCNLIYSAGEKRCNNCKSTNKLPNIVLYGNNISKENYKRSELALRKTDVILVIGTSLEVQPLSNLVLYNGEETVIWIDKKYNEVYLNNQYVKFIKADFDKFF